MQNPLDQYVLHLADSTLILGHRNSEWTGHGPILEQDIALSNIALDLIGQSRNFYQYAASLMNVSGNAVTEDTLAFLRDVREFRNSLICELPNGDWGRTVLRQFFFSAFQKCQYSQLIFSTDTQIAAIAEKSLKEVTYHLRWSGEWVIRLGDGTEESHQRMLKALDFLWDYCSDLFQDSLFEEALAEQRIVPLSSSLRNKWLELVQPVLNEATLTVEHSTQDLPSRLKSGGKNGVHTEHLGFLLAEMQFLQRAYPGNEW